jgi:hypothetical protein
LSRPLVITLALCAAFLVGVVFIWRGAHHGDPAARKSGKLYVVQRLLWIYDDRSVPLRESEPADAGFPVRAFASREEAEEHCRGLNLAAAEANQPFQHGRRWGQSFPSLDDFTSMSTGDFFAWLEQEGIEPPEGQKAAWQKWTNEPEASRRFNSDSYAAWQSWWDGPSVLTDGQRARILEKLDKVRYYEVVEVEADL